MKQLGTQYAPHCTHFPRPTFNFDWAKVGNSSAWGRPCIGPKCHGRRRLVPRRQAAGVPFRSDPTCLAPSFNLTWETETSSVLGLYWPKPCFSAPRLPRMWQDTPVLSHRRHLAQIYGFSTTKSLFVRLWTTAICDMNVRATPVSIE